MPGAKNLSVETKRVAIELHKAHVPLKQIMAQLEMSKCSLWRILSVAKKSPSLPVKKRKPGSGRKSTITTAVLVDMKKVLARTPTLTAKKLKAIVPGLSHLSIRHIQKICLEQLKLPSRKMARKPLLTEKMKEKRLVFAHQYGHWTADDWKLVMFSDESHFELEFSRATRCRRPIGSDRFNPASPGRLSSMPPRSWPGAASAGREGGPLSF